MPNQLNPHIPHGGEAPILPEQTLFAGHELRPRESDPGIMGAIDLGIKTGSDDELNSNRVLILNLSGNQPTTDSYGPYIFGDEGQSYVFGAPFVLFRYQEENGKKIPKFYPFFDNTKVEIGRSTDAGISLGLSQDSISRMHASVSVDMSTIKVSDKGSVNGTKLVNPADVLGQNRLRSDYTKYAQTFLKDSGREGFISPKDEIGWGFGVLMGAESKRNIIGMDTPIDTGVIVNVEGCEALVIDSQRANRIGDSSYDVVAKKVMDQISDPTNFGLLANSLKMARGRSLDNKLKIVLDTTMETLRYDLEATNSIAEKYGSGNSIDLNVYMHEGVGVCRIQAALAAFLLEKMVQNGVLNGSVSIDRNELRRIGKEPGGHAWTRFTDQTGMVYIIDPAQKYSGPLKNTIDDTSKWDYRRTSDMILQMLGHS